MSESAGLELLLSHYDDGKPVLAEGLPGESAAEGDPPTERADADHFWDEGGDPNDLEDQRWGVIAPEGPDGDRLLQLIRPLLEARKASQGGHEVKLFRAPAKLDMAAAARWRKEVFDKGADLAIDLPRYQLILGDLGQVPLSIQQVQGSDGFVGRLSFPDDRGYESYVDKLLRSEGLAPTASEARSIFYSVNDGTPATAVGHRALVQPGVELARKRQQAGQYPAREILAFGGPESVPSPTELLDVAASPDPAMLFTLSHGAGAPRAGWRTPAAQREGQGAMQFGSEGSLTGSELGARPFLPGGVWFMLACYGGGTPDVSAYRHWLERLREARQFGGDASSILKALPAGAPFIAALPTAALANPNGPLAFMGHIDLAWTYSFEERDGGKAIGRPAKFVSIARSVVKGDRVGIGFRELGRAFQQANVELTALYDAEAEGAPRDAARLGHLWMLRQDLAGYVLLGDPAAKLALSKGRATQANRPAQAPLTPEVAGAPAREQAAPPAPTPVATPVQAAAPPMPVQAPAPVAAAPKAPAPVEALPIALEALEEAIGHLLAGERGLKDIAEEYKVDRAQLRRLADLYRRGGRLALGQE